MMDLRYITREALINLKRSGTMAYVAILTMTITLLIFGLFLLFSTNVSQALGNLKGRAVMVAYLEDNLALSKLEYICSIVSQMKGVREVKYVTKEEALAQFRKELGDQSFILEALDSNPLPASLEIKADLNLGEEEINKLVTKIKSLVGISGVDYSPKLVEVLSHLSLLLKVVLLGIGTIFALTTLFIIFNTIKLVLFSRSREIEIMRLVGATDSFISWPYLLEGSVQGLIAGLTATIVLWAVYQLVLYKINQIGFIPFGFTFLSWKRALIIVISGIILGFLGTFVSLRYFLVKREWLSNIE